MTAPRRSLGNRSPLVPRLGWWFESAPGPGPGPGPTSLAPLDMNTAVPIRRSRRVVGLVSAAPAHPRRVLLAAPASESHPGRIRVTSGSSARPKDGAHGSERVSHGCTGVSSNRCILAWNRCWRRPRFFRNRFALSCRKPTKIRIAVADRRDPAAVEGPLHKKVSMCWADKPMRDTAIPSTHRVRPAPS